MLKKIIFENWKRTCFFVCTMWNKDRLNKQKRVRLLTISVLYPIRFGNGREIYGSRLKCIVKIRTGIDRISCTYKLKQLNQSMNFSFFRMILIFSYRDRLLRGSLLLKFESFCVWVRGWDEIKKHLYSFFVNNLFCTTKAPAFSDEGDGRIFYSYYSLHVSFIARDFFSYFLSSSSL